MNEQLSGAAISRLNRKAEAHDDYMGAIQQMAQRQRQMSVEAQRGDAFARGWVAAMHEFSLAVQAQLARRIGS